MLDSAEKKSLAQLYRDHLLNDVMPFWEKRTWDEQYGGYLTCFDRKGELTSANKGMWVQGRQLYMFSALYNQLEKRPTWLELARKGRDFMCANGYAGNGRWYYQMDRQGKVNESRLSLYTDAFALMGLCEYAVAAGTNEDMGLIEETYSAYERNFSATDFGEYFHFIHDPRYDYHGKYMITINLAGLAERVLGSERVRPLIDRSLEQILHVFAKDEHEALFEVVTKDGKIDEHQGPIINPGHVLECMWFCMAEARRRKDQSIIDRCIQISDWAYARGYDPEYGGIYDIVTLDGYDLTQSDYIRSNYLRFDPDFHPDEKSWWVHSEALYALLLGAVLTQNQQCYTRFSELHEWTFDKYSDREYGEWYMKLHRDGTPKNTDKGAPYRGAFHVPRALMLIMLLLEE